MRRLLPASPCSWLLPSGTRCGGLSERMRIPPEMASSPGCLPSQSQPHSRQGSRSNPSCALTPGATRDPDARGHTGEPAAPLSRTAGAATVPGRAHSRASGRPHRYAAAEELLPQSEGPKCGYDLHAGMWVHLQVASRPCRSVAAGGHPRRPGRASWAGGTGRMPPGWGHRSDSTSELPGRNTGPGPDSSGARLSFSGHRDQCTAHIAPGDGGRGIAIFAAAGLSHGLAKERQSAVLFAKGRIQASEGGHGNPRASRAAGSGCPEC
jgi:hypothetical protein